MYASFFGLNEKPFSITPDPRYLYLSRRHAEALAHLLYGITESGGFIQLTGEVGTGKTTVVRSLLEQLPEHADVALVLNPRLSPQEFLLTICDELHIPVPDRDSQKQVVDALNHRLLEAHAAGRRVVLIVDEAQNLAADVLEQVRLLTNLETAKQKLLQIILIGQPELREVLARTDLRQLAQRITGRYHLEPLESDETRGYVRHRLEVAGGRAELFTAGAMTALHRASGGVPRLVNVIADRALLGAWSKEERTVTRPMALKAAREVFGAPLRQSRRWPTFVAIAMGLTGIAVLAGVATELWRQHAADEARAEEARAAPVVDAQPESPFRDEPAPASMPSATPVAEAAATDEPPEPADATESTQPAEAAPTLAERLAAGAAGTDAAFAALFRLWNAEYVPEQGAACEQAVAQELRCALHRGTWSGLVDLNHPAILVLTDEAGNDHQVVLAGVPDTSSARLLVGGEALTVPLGELLQRWYGEYLVVWRPQAGNGRTLLRNASGADVLWLRRTLGELRGQPVAPQDSPVYDAAVESAVRAFQRERRLQVDGIAGAMTLLSLNEALGIGGRPRLRETL
jgi:general secretion pathway protein A